jgi:hypothetical protein
MNMKKNLFGINEPAKKEPIKEKSKPSFPEVNLIKGLNKQEATSESVFWHRILLNKAIRQQKSVQFLQVLSNEIALKKGQKDAYLAILDSLRKTKD